MPAARSLNVLSERVNDPVFHLIILFNHFCPFASVSEMRLSASAGGSKPVRARCCTSEGPLFDRLKSQLLSLFKCVSVCEQTRKKTRPNPPKTRPWAWHTVPPQHRLLLDHSSLQWAQVDVVLLCVSVWTAGERCEADLISQEFRAKFRLVS